MDVNPRDGDLEIGNPGTDFQSFFGSRDLGKKKSADATADLNELVWAALEKLAKRDRLLLARRLIRLDGLQTQCLRIGVFADDLAVLACA